MTGHDGGVTRDWDAATYDRIADPMTRRGTAVLDRHVGSRLPRPEIDYVSLNILATRAG